MKKKILFFIALFLCVFSINTAYAACDWPENFNSETRISLINFVPSSFKSSFVAGDRIDFEFYKTGASANITSNMDFELLFKSTKNGIVSTFLKEVTPNSNESNNQGYHGYFIIPDTFEEDDYTYYGLNIIVNKKNSLNVDDDQITTIDSTCGKFIFNSNDLEENKEFHPIELSFGAQTKTIKVVSKRPEERNLIKDLALYTQTGVYYIGDKITFNVSTTEEITSLTVGFKSKEFVEGNNYGYFSVDLIPDEPHNGSYRSFSGYIPKTRSGYYGTVDTPKTEMIVHPGNYELSSFTLVDTDGKKLMYTTDKEIVYKGDYLYYEPKPGFVLKQPTADELNDVSLVFDKVQIKNTTTGIGSAVSVNLSYSYNASNKKVKSMYFVFHGEKNDKMVFTAYLKNLDKDPIFIVPSSAALDTYLLNSIGVNLEAKDGTNNTIIINGETESGKYSDIFKQKLTINKEPSYDYHYFSADELNSDVYKKIKDSEETSIVINADNYTIIPEQLFDLIKDTNKQLVIKYNGNEWVFKGTDIVNTKNLDVAMKIYDINKSDLSDSLKKSITDGSIVVEFKNNGELPEKTLIRLKDTEVVNKLKSDKVYIYYADVENDKLKKVAVEVEKTEDGYIEFYISHNYNYFIFIILIFDLNFNSINFIIQ